MASKNENPRIGSLLSLVEGEERATPRYPIALKLRYHIPSHDLQGQGTTLRVGRSAVLFMCNEKLRLDYPITLVINWPVLLDGVCPLNLLIRGYTVAQEAERVEVRIHTHEFRTAGKRTLALARFARD